MKDLRLANIMELLQELLPLLTHDEETAPEEDLGLPGEEPVEGGSLEIIIGGEPEGDDFEIEEEDPLAEADHGFEDPDEADAYKEMLRSLK